MNFNTKVIAVAGITWSNLGGIIPYGIGIILNYFRKISERTNGDWLEKWWNQNIKNRVQKKKRKAIAFLLNHSTPTLLVIIALPFIPLVDALAVAALRLSRTKYDALLIIIANTFRVLIVIIIYTAFPEIPETIAKIF